MMKPITLEYDRQLNKTRFGCNQCGREKPTEMFVGFNGNVLWFCGECQDLLNRKPKKVAK
jgi:ribosomal protein L24E